MADPTVGELRYDKIVLKKVGGNAELQILNASRDIIGPLWNTGDGNVEFIESDGVGGEDQVFIDPDF